MSAPHTLTMECPKLQELRALTIAALIARARLEVPEHKLRPILDVDHQAHNVSLQLELASLIYYENGSELAANKSWNDMTRLQLQYELIVWGDTDSLEQLTDWKLRLRLASTVFLHERAQRNLNQQQQQTNSNQQQPREPDSGFEGSGVADSLDESVEPTESDESDESAKSAESAESDHEGKAPMYTRNHSQAMRFS